MFLYFLLLLPSVLFGLLFTYRPTAIITTRYVGTLYLETCGDLKKYRGGTLSLNQVMLWVYGFLKKDIRFRQVFFPFSNSDGHEASREAL